MVYNNRRKGIGSSVCQNDKACSSFVDIGMHPTSLQTTLVFLGTLLIASTQLNDCVSTTFFNNRHLMCVIRIYAGWKLVYKIVTKKRNMRHEIWLNISTNDIYLAVNNIFWYINTIIELHDQRIREH